MTDSPTMEILGTDLLEMDDAAIQAALTGAGFDMAGTPANGWKLNVTGYPVLVCGTVNTLQVRVSLAPINTVTFADSGFAYVPPAAVGVDGRTP